jgi:SsrA-binding protein
MILVANKKIGLNYTFKETVTAGIELFGHEVKSLRNKLGSLEGSRAVIRGGECYLVGATIPPYQSANVEKSYDEGRTRRLLLQKSEIAKLIHTEERKESLVPVKFFLAHNLIKVELAVAKKIQRGDKREKLKEKDFRNNA